MRIRSLFIESARSGVIAALAMIPFGLFFKFLHLPIGNYGPKFAMMLFGHATPFILFVLHLTIGCVSALPLVWELTRIRNRIISVAVGAVYGLAYYVIVNSLALPLFFGDPTPWQLGLSFVYPSLFIHLVYGISIALTTKVFIANENKEA